MKLTFDAAFTVWQSAASRPAILTDAKYQEMVQVLRDGMIHHPKYPTWARRFYTDALNGVIRLWTNVDMWTKRAPSGRHAKKQRILVDPKAAATASPTDDGDTESPAGESLSLLPTTTSSSSDAAPPTTLILPASGRAYPQQPRLIRKQIVCFSQVKDILKKVHDIGHPGVDGTYELIGQSYIGISRDLVTAWVKRCTTCQQRFRKRPPAPRFLHPIPTKTFLHHVQADCVFYVDKRHAVHCVQVVLHYICIATKWNELLLLSSKEGSVMRAAFWEIFTRIGPPANIQSDNGSEFNNPEMDDLLNTCSLDKINHRNGAPYKPESQGVCERNHRTMQRILDIMTTEERYLEWDFQDMLRLTQYWMNSYTHRSTKQSAYLLVFGRTPPLMNTGPAVSMDEIVDAVEEEMRLEEEKRRAKAAAADAAAQGKKGVEHQPEVTVNPPSPPDSEAAAALPGPQLQPNDQRIPMDDVGPPINPSAGPAASDHVVPMEVDHQSLAVHTDRQQAAQRNHSIYQQQWQAQANRGLADQTFSVGELVLLQIVPPRGYGQSKLAKQLDKQRVVVMEQLAYSKYTIYTEFGFLKDSVHANTLTKATADTVWPEGLRNATDPQIAHDLLQQYKADKHGRKQSVLTINAYINNIMTHHYKPVAATVEMRPPQKGDADFQPVVKIRQKRQRK